MMHTYRRSAAITVLFTLAIAAGSEAAVTRVGLTVAAIAAPSRGTAVAYDPINHVYLVVGASGVVWGRFVDRSGNPIGTPFTIQGNTGLYGAYPRPTFSADANNGAGGFLVAWSQDDTGTGTAWVIHGRMVAFGLSGAYGADNVLSPDNGWGEEAIYGAYSTGSHEFLLVHRTNGSFIVRGLRVSNAATPLAAPFTISQTGQYDNNPSVAYNPVTNQYLVCWQMFTAANTGLLHCRFVQPGSGALGAGPIQVQATGSVWFTDTTYNPNTNQFLVTWDEGHGTATLGRLVNADGSLPGPVIAITNRYAGYDGTATAYNPVSRSFFVVAYDLVGDLTQDGGVELNDAGQPKDTGLQVTAACLPNLPLSKCGNFYPQIAASGDDPNWLVSAATSFGQTSIQLLGGTAAGGGPTPTPAPTPAPTPTAHPMMYVDLPANNATVSTRGFAIAGWAVDAGSTAGPGVDVVVTWAYPSTGAAPTLAGIATYGNDRPDISSWLQSSRFGPSGYVFPNVQLPAGRWMLAVYAHSTVNNSWNTPFLVNVTVAAPPSTPLMAVDLPGPDQTQSQNLRVAGWAVDLGAGPDGGVDWIDVWAYPASGAPQIYVGGTKPTFVRDDIKNWLGVTGLSGYDFTSHLDPGEYTVVVFAHSSITGTFNNAKTVHVFIR